MINISKCTNVSLDVLRHMSRCCIYVENLGLGYLEELSDEAIARISEKCPKLTAIDISGNDQLSSECINTLLSNHSMRVKHLIMNRLTKVGSPTLLTCY